MPSLINTILSALAASGHRLPNVPGPGLRSQVSFPTGPGVCTAKQQETIMRAMGEAVIITNNWIATAQRESLPYKTFIEPENIQEHGSGPLDTINRLVPGGGTLLDVVNNVAKQIQGILSDDKVKLDITCDLQHTSCKRGTVVAETFKADRRINFCSPFFEKATRSTDLSNLKCTKDNVLDIHSLDMRKTTTLEDLSEVRSLTIIHELAHMSNTGSREIDDKGEIMDIFYGPYACEAIALAAPRAALANADNYAWAMMAQFLNTVCWGPKDTTYYRSWDVDAEFNDKLNFWKESYARMTEISDKTQKLETVINGLKPDLLKSKVTFDAQGKASLANAAKDIQDDINQYNTAVEAHNKLVPANARAQAWLQMPVNDLMLDRINLNDIKEGMNTIRSLHKDQKPKML